jgi:hypothetical protein
MALMRFVAVLACLATCAFAAPRFDVQFAPEAKAEAVDGRLIVVVSKKTDGEPRLQVSWGIDTQQVFGVDVDGWKPGDVARVDAAAAGHPLASLRDLPPGTYTVQAVLNIYETFRRSDGRVVKLHMDQGEGQQWNRSPGNLYSKPQKVEITKESIIPITLSEVLPPIQAAKDTKYIRHVRIESKLLTAFWGRPMHLGAAVLVPDGFDDHSQQKYPIAFLQGHFTRSFAHFRATPPSPETTGPARRAAVNAYRLYQDWTAGRLPKMLVVITQHATPYYDDSYGVNTANMGPYGDALTKELYPQIEREFRAIGEPWARVVFGGSTGGWMTLAQQIFYPEYFGGAWGFCPDPVDFHAFQTIDIYKDQNAYFDEGPFQRFPKLLGRMPDDHVLATMESFSKQEAVLGTRGRSGGQLDAFHATFGPASADGYPAKLWNADTGSIDPDVAKYWQEHFDLNSYLEREWDRLGTRLVGKIHVTMGTKDTFYLDAAAHRMEKFLESTKLPGKGPYYGGSFEFGDNEPHCYAGKISPGQPLLSYYLPVFADHMTRMAPQGSDVTSWRTQ